MRQIIQDFYPTTPIQFSENTTPHGTSASPKELIFHILENNSQPVSVLDIGFGAGELGMLIKSKSETNHWVVDGIDGYFTNCQNTALFNRNIYRNIWHGLAQELNTEIISKYNIICLLDVIEHLDIESAKYLFRTLLNNLGDNSFLFISTPLWFYPEFQNQEGDMEEHLIGIPASSMFSLIPKMYAINSPLVGGFVYTKESLEYIDFFQPTSNKSFSIEMGKNILKALNINIQEGVVYKAPV